MSIKLMLENQTFYMTDVKTILLENSMFANIASAPSTLNPMSRQSIYNQSY